MNTHILSISPVENGGFSLPDFRSKTDYAAMYQAIEELPFASDNDSIVLTVKNIDARELFNIRKAIYNFKNKRDYDLRTSAVKGGGALHVWKVPRF